VVARGRIDADERRAVLLVPVERLLEPLALDPALVAQLDRQAALVQALGEPVELAQFVLVRIERGRELQQERAELGGLVASSVSPIRRCSRSGVSSTRPRSLVWASARSSGGSESRPAECRESSRWSFTSKVNRSGVTSAQRATVFCVGTA